jgi:hypothetical protein
MSKVLLDLRTILKIPDNLRSALKHKRLSNPLWSELVRIYVDMLEPALNRRLNAVDLLAELNALEKGTPKLAPRFFCNSCALKASEENA